MNEVIEEVAGEIMAGRNFFVARDRAIEKRVDEWVSKYGRECADMAVRSLHLILPSEFLTPEERETKRVRDVKVALFNLEWGSPECDTWWNRLSIRLLGRRFTGLALAASVASLALGSPSEALAGSGQHIDPKWRALAACGVSKSGLRRERACRPFNSAERGAFRNYDGSGAGAPREWELPRAWERSPN